LKSYFAAYGEFFSRERQTFNTRKVIAGAMGVEADVAKRTGLSTEPNHYVSVPGLSYSDKYGGAVVSIPLKHRNECEVMVTGEPDLKPYYPHDVELKRNGVIYLRPEHSAAVYYLNNRGFQDSPYAESESSIVNTLVGQEVANCIKGRPSLSMGLLRPTTVNNGSESAPALSAYILANETTITPEFVAEFGSDSGQVGERVIYLDEWVADPGISSESTKGLATHAKLLTEWLRVVEEHYPQKGETIKIVTAARESTSLPIIKKTLERRGLEHAVEDIGLFLGEGTPDNGRILVITIKPEDVQAQPPFLDEVSE
jgi:hypothetical protein